MSTRPKKGKMLTNLKNRLTFANVIACVALFAALGGTSYAAVKITGASVKNNTLTTKDVKNRSLLAKDFRVGQLPAGPQGPQGPQGLRGEKGETGATGPQGPAGITGVVRATATSPLNSNSPKNAYATCPQGTVIVGDGAFIDGATTAQYPALATDVAITGVIPTPESSEHGPDFAVATAIEEEPTSAHWTVTAYALCATVAP